jgi:hypothetical protein
MSPGLDTQQNRSIENRKLNTRPAEGKVKAGRIKGQAFGAKKPGRCSVEKPRRAIPPPDHVRSKSAIQYVGG